MRGGLRWERLGGIRGGGWGQTRLAAAIQLEREGGQTRLAAMA